jgi:UDPglucose 6-dehydrogenase
MLSKVVVIGLGYVGLTTGIGLANLGHSVVGVDLNVSKVEQINLGKLPIYEPGLEEMLRKVVADERFSAHSSYEPVDESVDFVFVCVATPSSVSGKADLSFVDSAISMVLPKLSKGTTVIMKSTLPIGTAQMFSGRIRDKGLVVASNPEFLAEGTALLDFGSPSRIVVGADDQAVAANVMSLYDGIEAPRLTCGLSSAETIKHASNAFLALKLSYVNELASLCVKTGAVMSEVTKGVSLDPRIGDKFLTPGPGWGGSCFPKDTVELAETAKSLGTPMLTVEAAISSNTMTKARVIERIEEQFVDGLSGVSIAVWGLAFKANTDDVRDSPAVDIIEGLLKRGTIVRAFDPMARVDPRDSLSIHTSPDEACRGVDALIVLTEWPDFELVNPSEMRVQMNTDPYVLDTRGILDRSRWSEVFPRFESLSS